MQMINKTTKLIVALGGGSLNCINEDGEIAWTVGLAEGVHRASTYTELLDDHQSLEPDNGVAVHNVGGRIRRTDLGQVARESGANPDFTVTSASRMVRELDLKVRKLDRTEAKMAKRLAALESLEKVRPKTPAKGDGDVIDGGDTGPVTVDPVVAKTEAVAE